MRKFSKIISLVIIFTLLTQCFFVFNPLSATATTTADEITDLNKKIDEKKDKIKQLEDTINKYNQSIKQKQLEATSLRNQLSILGDHIDKIKTDILLTEEKIKKTQLEIDSLKLSIKEKETVIERQKTIITKMIRDLNREQNKNYLTVMLTNNTFSDFYTEVQQLETLQQDLGRSLKSLRLAKTDLETKKTEQDKIKADYEKLKTDLEQKRLNLSDQTNVKENLLTQTVSSEWQYKTLVSSLRQQYQAIENEVRSYEREVQKKLAEKDKYSTSGPTTLIWPTPSHYITSYFHDPDYPYRYVFEHSGMDLRASQGTPIQAAASGYIARARTCSAASCYAYVLIVHTGNLSTLYGHLSKITVSADQYVNTGDIIGYSGGTPGTVGAGPFVTGPHLHFEVRASGIPVDPLGYLK